MKYWRFPEHLPDPYNRPAGLLFPSRCPIAQERGKQEVPTLEECEPGRK